MSAEKLRHTMLGVTSTIMKDRSTGKGYRFPKCQSEASKKLYRSLGMVHSTAVKEVTSLERYRNRIKYLDSKQ